MKFFKKSDVIVIVILILAGIIGLVLYRINFSERAAVADIYYYSELVKVVDLTEKNDYIFSIPQKPNVVFHVYKDGSIKFEESDCPDKICIKAGKLNTVGESAACLPNGIVIKIVSKNGYNNDDIDIVIGK